MLSNNNVVMPGGVGLDYFRDEGLEIQLELKSFFQEVHWIPAEGFSLYDLLLRSAWIHQGFG